MADRLDTPSERRRWRRPRVDPEFFGRGAEAIARFMGTARFLLYLTLFCAVWLVWNTFGPESMRFDSSEFGFTALTLMLSLQASYAAPLILLAQNRQADRDRVSAEQDRQRSERNLADTEYLAREMAAARVALSEVATRDFVRSELRGLLEDIVEEREARIRELEQELAQMTRDRQAGAPDAEADQSPAPADGDTDRTDRPATGGGAAPTIEG